MVAIETLELAQSIQQDAAIQSVFVMYNFLPQFCQSAQDQCTQALLKQPEIMQYNHKVVSPSLHTVYCSCESWRAVLPIQQMLFVCCAHA